MIHRIYSSLPMFKTLALKPGLNVLVAKKEVGASDKQTRNRAGKTSLIEIVHFLMGSDAGKDSLFRLDALVNESFGIEFDLGGEQLCVERSGQQKNKIHIAGASFLDGTSTLANSEWVELLGEKMFGLRQVSDVNGRMPTFRSLFSYFVRRQLGEGFTAPEKQANKQQVGDYQVALQFLLGLDWRITSDRSHGALDNFSQLQGEAARQEARVEFLRQRFESAEQMESAKNELDIERNRLTLRLRRDFSEQKERLSAAILAFEETSKRLYESAGRMQVEVTPNGPTFQFPMQGSRSKGIKNMQIFCFDMMLMRLCARRGVGPGFLIHDSHLFDGVDGRQLISTLKVGAETAQELGFQYLVTMNEDDAFKETVAGFNIADYMLDTVLTDATEDGGLFGFRF